MPLGGRDAVSGNWRPCLMWRLLLLLRWFDAVSDDIRIDGDKFPGKGNERKIARLGDVIEEGIDWLGMIPS